MDDDLSSGVLKTEWRNEEVLVELCNEVIAAHQPLPLLKKAPAKDANDELFTMGVALLPLINPWNQELSHRLVGSLYDQTGFSF